MSQYFNIKSKKVKEKMDFFADNFKFPADPFNFPYRSSKGLIAQDNKKPDVTVYVWCFFGDISWGINKPEICAKGTNIYTTSKH
ncbi:unnamed protein product [marine sediment metagenome]|uniref:Uncharacterized protein n=1 Tax=marine sediment metagenome TaxID=412755 RepID=X0Z8K2_9ZZZZ